MDGIRNPTSSEAAQNKYVKLLIPPRVKQLEYIAEHFIQRIIETVDSVPFGIRWICKPFSWNDTTKISWKRVLSAARANIEVDSLCDGIDFAWVLEEQDLKIYVCIICDNV